MLQISRRAVVLVACASTLVAALASTAPAQLKMPQESPAATLSLDVGITTLTLVYHRPAMRGRDPMKDLGDTKGTQGVWRLGANDATTLAFTDPVTLGGKLVPAGTYALFAKVGPERWTLILNKTAQQWGSYFYDEKQDVLRFDVPVEHVAKESRREWFTLALDPLDEKSAQVTIAWGDVKLAFRIAVDVDAILEQHIQKALESRGPKDWRTLMQIAQYRCKRKEKLEEALKLIDEALEIDVNPWTCEWKGRILHELADDETAIPLIEKAVELSRSTSFPQGYRDGLLAFLKVCKGEK